MTRTTNRNMVWLLMVLAQTLLLVACGGGETKPSSSSDFEAPPEPVNIGGNGDLYDPDRLVSVDIRMNASDFAELKSQGRTLAETSRECVPEFEYTEYTATVTIDGSTLDNVRVRKKGFIGSLSPSRPSIKLDFDDLQEGRTYQNMTRMTLNNNRQDPSNARQCLAYDLFREAGIATPRCNFAKVSVNGQELGIFTNVEPVKKPFLARTFGDDDGNLYESSIADFGTYLNDRFEKKTNERENDRTDLIPVAEALDLPDAEFINVLQQYLDLDEFIRFWALETLTGFWDSASGNANNFYIYRSPRDNLFHFIPWGPDTAFNRIHPLKPGSGPLFRNFRLSSRLYDIPTYRQQYFDELQTLLATLWDESALLAELDRIQALTGTTNADLAAVRTFISGRGVSGDADFLPSQRIRLEEAMAAPDASTRVVLLDDSQPDCSAPLTSRLTGTVKAVNGTDTGAFNFTLPDGHNASASLTFAAYEVDSLVYSLNTDSNPGVVSLLLIGADFFDDFTPYVLQIFIEKPDYVEGTHELHGFATNVLLFAVDESLPGDVRPLATGHTGTLTITDAGTGSREGDVELVLDINLEYLPGVN